MSPRPGPPKTGLYVHWPYCARICPYCDFNVARARGVDEGAWGDAFAADLRHLADRFGPRPLVSAYLGGGTPSLMGPALIGRILREAEAIFGLAPGAEITLEANPNDVDDGTVAGWLAAGVNRLSLGVQSLRDEDLAFLGRDHGADAARRAVGATLRAFPRSSFDLISALPGQMEAAWAERLAEALALGPAHLSIYQLTVEPGTAFGRQVARGDWLPADEDRAADLYELTAAMTAEAGLPAYEVSSHARPGFEAVHNGLYWEGADWLAIGPGGHGRLTRGGERVATEGARAIGQYLSLAPEARSSETVLTAGEALTERLAGGLRLARGLPIAELGEAGSRVAARAGPLVEDGFLMLEGGVLASTGRGRLVLDALTAELASVL